jgi:hypothetical protein
MPAQEGVAFLPARPVTPARGPPSSWAEILQVHDDRDAIQTSPDDLPVIDIRSLRTVPTEVGCEAGLRPG